MHGLNTIIALNAKAQAEQAGYPSAEGWEVKLDSELPKSDPYRWENPNGTPGVIHVINKDLHLRWVVDASDPHCDAELVHFHQNWKGAPSIAARVEALASQHRRILCRAA